MAGAETPAFFDLSHLRKVLVSGPDARKWLNDLTSADIGRLEPGAAIRSLLLSPTGRLRAEFTVSATTEGYLLLQDPDQRPADALLSTYVLSSEVSLNDRTEDLTIFTIPGPAGPFATAEASKSAPSWTGTGVDLIAPSDLREAVADELGAVLRPGSPEELERLRVASGRARLGVDATEEDLPEEAGMGDAVAFDKGCYLGQEAVARVRNLGHPRRLLMAFEATGHVLPGDTVIVMDREAGVVTSVAGDGNGTLLLARIKWDEREGSFRTSNGLPLRPRLWP